MGLVLLLTGAISLVFLFILWKYSYWYRRGVPQGNPLKLFGDLNDTSITSLPIIKHYFSLARKFSDKPFFGVYSVGSPVLFIRDKDMFKDVLLTKFNSFGDNGFEVTEEMDPIVSRDPFFQPNGERWKQARTSFSSLMTPARLRTMISDMALVAKETADYLKEQKHESGKGDGADIKNVASRAMTSLLIRLTLSLDAGVFKEGKNPFVNATQEIFEHWTTQYLMSIMLMLCPKLGHMLGASYLPKSVIDFFTNVISEQKEYRIKNGITRNDILDTIMKKKLDPKLQGSTASGNQATAHDKDSAGWDVLSVIIMFITEGFETTSTNIATAITELARHAEIQEALREQILRECPLGKDITEDVINDIPLLQNVLLESVRLYPPGMLLQRIVTENVTLQAKTGEKIHLKKGVKIQLPIIVHQRDPDIFPDPEKFDPDRFADENQKRSLLSFGDGPRQCPGQRFSSNASRILLATIVREFQLELSPKTKIPLEPVNNGGLFTLSEVMIRFVPV